MFISEIFHIDNEPWIKYVYIEVSFNWEIEVVQMILKALKSIWMRFQSTFQTEDFFVNTLIV